MADDYRDSLDDDVPVLDEVIRPGRPLDTVAQPPSQTQDQVLHTEVAAIIERHARAAIEEIAALLERHRDPGD
jgi:hypothetical protein